jgi:hypothetical protein
MESSSTVLMQAVARGPCYEATELNSADVNNRGVPIKGFKGKGAVWANHARAHLAEIHAAMQTLSRETRSVRGHDYILTVHARGRNGQRSLRWRLSGRPARHVSWTTIVAQIVLLPPALAQWYRQAHAAALSLNYQEMAARHELRLAERCQDETTLADQSYELAWSGKQ